jgi:cytochrome P450
VATVIRSPEADAHEYRSDVSPPVHPLAGHLPAFRRDPLGFLTECARNYGDAVPLCFVHKRAVLLLNPADIERVLATEHRQFVKPVWLRTAAVRRVLGNGLVNSEGAEWRLHRQASQPAFASGLMEGYGKTISELAAEMLDGWRPGETRDLQRDMTHLTLEVVVKTLFGVSLSGWSEQTGDAIDTLLARFTARGTLFGMIPGPPTLREVLAARQLNRTIDRFIREHHRTAGSARSDSLLSRLERSTDDGGLALTGSQLRDHLKTFLAAGYESSALVLCWTLIMLATHPEAANALARELREALQGKPPGPADLPALPYTRAIVQETLRLYPPLWMTGRQAVAACSLGGLEIPADTLIMTSQWAVQRLPRYFPEPDKFRPERWLGSETSDLPRFAYFPFGGGPRVCIGQKFAVMEVSLLLATIVQRFRMSIEPGQNLDPEPTMTLRPPAGLRVRLTAAQ